LAALGNNLVHYLLVIAAALPALALAGLPPGLPWLWSLPALLAVQLAATLGLSLALSSLNVIFRDLEFLTGILIQILFFLTPIIYSETSLPAPTRAVLRWNPMYYIFPQWRSLVLHGTVEWTSLGIGAAAAAVILAAGYAIYRSVEARLAESL